MSSVRCCVLATPRAEAAAIKHVRAFMEDLPSLVSVGHEKGVTPYSAACLHASRQLQSGGLTRCVEVCRRGIAHVHPEVISSICDMR